MFKTEELKMTIDELKQIKNCEIVEEQALKEIEIVFMLSMFAFNAYNKIK